MSITVVKALHVVLRLGMEPLERAYLDLPADQQAEPCVRQAIDALCKLETANVANLEKANGFAPCREPLEGPLSELAAAWSIASTGLGPDDVIERWESRHVNPSRVVITRKKGRHVQR